MKSNTEKYVSTYFIIYYLQYKTLYIYIHWNQIFAFPLSAVGYFDCIPLPLATSHEKNSSFQTSGVVRSDHCAYNRNIVSRDPTIFALKTDRLCSRVELDLQRPKEGGVMKRGTVHKVGRRAHPNAKLHRHLNTVCMYVYACHVCADIRSSHAPFSTLALPQLHLMSAH